MTFFQKLNILKWGRKPKQSFRNKWRHGNPPQKVVSIQWIFQSLHLPPSWCTVDLVTLSTFLACAGDHLRSSLHVYLPYWRGCMSSLPYPAAEGHLVSMAAFPECWRVSSCPHIFCLSSLLSSIIYRYLPPTLKVWNTFESRIYVYKRAGPQKTKPNELPCFLSA